MEFRGKMMPYCASQMTMAQTNTKKAANSAMMLVRNICSSDTSFAIEMLTSRWPVVTPSLFFRG